MQQKSFFYWTKNVREVFHDHTKQAHENWSLHNRSTATIEV